ncbi:CBS domain-containing protein [Aestuariivivens sediminicola]|uniref:CBS domain-containing protein n=1 Tax=Aestuariivivens sediminicola TaxID=2913560 RepID=UPI001F58811F|nr:CBS domain-containing protein [Aestuariivivens sediminicola]
MKLSELVINDIKPVKNSDKISDLQQLFNQLIYSHIPVVDGNNEYIGCLFETDVHCFDGNKNITDYSYALEVFYVKNTTLWLDVLEAFARNSSNIMPVLDENNNYLGYYELNDVISLFGDSPFFIDPGGIVVVEKGINDYSFSEISQIVESNGGKLLGAFISKMKNDVAQVTLKIGNASISDILQTFRRYSYNVVSGHEDDNYNQTLKDRSDYLNKYLNM